MTEACLLLTLVDRATGKVAYQALARRENLTRQAGSEQAIRDVVIRLLEELR